MRGTALCFVLSLVGCDRPAVVRGGADTPPPHPPVGARYEPVAVVELFTSEGCSSCPPADHVLGELVKDADPRVALLSFHVDYWDELGHPDRFASAAHTARQWAYARDLGQRGVFTPQAIVSGTSSHVGSERRAIRRTLDDALKRPAVAHISPKVAREDGVLRVSWAAEGDTDDAKMLVALTEDHLTTRVTAGENAGKTLVHDAVVRDAVDGDGRRGTAVFSTKGVALDHAKVVWVLTGRQTRAVRAAAWARP